MMPTAAILPRIAPDLTLAAIFGPTAIMAMILTIVALAAMVAAVALEDRREGRRLAMGHARTPHSLGGVATAPVAVLGR